MQSRKLILSGILLFGFILGIIAHPLVGRVLAQVASTEIYACVKDNGLVRISTTSTTCGTGETLLSWNTQGPAGPQGPQGPVGPQGPQGPAGSGGIGQYDPTKLTGHVLNGEAFVYKNFDNADFSNSVFNQLSIRQSNLRYANFTNVVFAYSALFNKLENEVDFSGSNFTGAKFTNYYTSPGNLTEYVVNFSNANFTDANLNYCTTTPYGYPYLGDCGGNDFSLSIFTGAIWSNTTCPDSYVTAPSGDTCEGHLVSL